MKKILIFILSLSFCFILTIPSFAYDDVTDGLFNANGYYVDDFSAYYNNHSQDTFFILKNVNSGKSYLYRCDSSIYYNTVFNYLYTDTILSTIYISELGTSYNSNKYDVNSYTITSESQIPLSDDVMVIWTLNNIYDEERNLYYSGNYHDYKNYLLDVKNPPLISDNDNINDVVNSALNNTAIPYISSAFEVLAIVGVIILAIFIGIKLIPKFIFLR